MGKNYARFGLNFWFVLCIYITSFIIWKWICLLFYYLDVLAIKLLFNLSFIELWQNCLCNLLKNHEISTKKGGLPFRRGIIVTRGIWVWLSLNRERRIRKNRDRNKMRLICSIWRNILSPIMPNVSCNRSVRIGFMGSRLKWVELVGGDFLTNKIK